MIYKRIVELHNKEMIGLTINNELKFIKNTSNTYNLKNKWFCFWKNEIFKWNILDLLYLFKKKLTNQYKTFYIQDLNNKVYVINNDFVYDFY